MIKGSRLFWLFVHILVCFLLLSMSWYNPLSLNPFENKELNERKVSFFLLPPGAVDAMKVFQKKILLENQPKFFFCICTGLNIINLINELLVNMISLNVHGKVK